MNEASDWLTTSKTIIIMEDREKGNDVTNFRPITCLLLMWKIFTGVLSDELYDHLESETVARGIKGVPKKIEGDKGPIIN